MIRAQRESAPAWRRIRLATSDKKILLFHKFQKLRCLLDLVAAFHISLLRWIR